MNTGAHISGSGSSQSRPLAERTQVFRFKNADLSADDVTQLVKVPVWAKLACLSIGCSSTGSPIGVLYLKQSNSASADLIAAATHTRPSWQPTGAAYSLDLDLIRTGANFLGLYWDRASGGTGAHWTDATGTPGTLPTITFHG